MKSYLAFLGALLLASAGLAQQAPRSDLTVDEIVNALSPAPKTRSLGRNLKVEPAKIDMTVNFDFDSTNLKNESKPQLERLAEALKNERLLQLRFQVEGHTDARGSANYNLGLSSRRADSVLSFLVQQGIDRERLQAVGKGFTELLEPADPASAKNRRVRIMTLE
ncbi:MAG: OmpA family protein [Betaproteobacteria bacterium]|nr:OmpA family protein [Betaproteobacteria bacterium]